MRDSCAEKSEARLVISAAFRRAHAVKSSAASAIEESIVSTGIRFVITKSALRRKFWPVEACGP